MFSYFKSFGKDRSDSPKLTEVPKESSKITQTPLPQAQADDSKKDTWVYIWNMTANSPGHAAVQIGGAKPKVKESDAGEYGSLHPEKIPSVGVTTVLPLPAHFATTLTEDMETLGESKSTPFISDMDLPPQPLASKTPKPLPPDEIYHFKGLDTSKMSKKMAQARKEVDSGDMSYQLLPNLNLVKFFKDSASFIAQDPVEIEMRRRANENDPTNSSAHNCTSLASDILKQGGIPINNPNYIPWSITPNGLSDELSNFGNKL
ncbi:hypothetical protein [Legionella waltersii]|uniref:Uncharacterized protein n=1 Tax=Legionella waltersii TaxID=66969 RepID=A0A0W1A1M0_9GAMM|nr:hypothetical protein [Legionella waltersii]KTD75129.1 hypothetical protein Lwal_3170 [Legionella waltersii]SNV04919.1 Uncharacterised protein [Legionella waltersii]